jgi:hypothetical protein
VSIAGRPARERLVALALLALLFAALWAGPVSAYLDIVGSGADEISRQSQLLERYRALALALAPATPDTAEKPGAAPLMLPQLPEAQAIALLQESIKKAADTSRVEVQSLQVLRSENLPSAVKLGARISASGDNAGLARLLYAAETARPTLFPDNLQIHARPGGPGNTAGMLDFQLDVSAFMPVPSR